jgi:hypothetical protein
MKTDLHWQSKYFHRYAILDVRCSISDTGKRVFCKAA